MVGAYFDSGILVKAYCPEPNSPAAISLITSERAPLPLIFLHEAEIRNAFRLKAFRKEISVAALEAALGQFDDDIKVGRFLPQAFPVTSIHRRTEILSSRHAVATGARILDIIHVAAALEIGSTRFYSLDQRQRSVAKKAGLKVLPATLT